VTDVEVIFDDTGKILSVNINAEQDLLFRSFLGEQRSQKAGVSRVSYATDNVQPISIGMVLDVSSSMRTKTDSGLRRIEVLKRASEDLFHAIESTASQPRVLREKIRTGMSAFDKNLVSEYTLPMGVGWDHTLMTIRRMETGSGTNSTPGFQKSYNLLRNDRAIFETSQEIMIFISDGNNENDEIDAETLTLCNQAKNDDVIIYTVAFENAESGAAFLRQCASEPKSEHFFNATSGTEFRQAFQRIGEGISEYPTRLVQ